MVKTTKYIYHSEKTKTTCEDCKKHDNEVYYDIKDIPKLPIHPNCKCWIEVIELNVSNNSKCDCADKFIVLENNLINSIKNTETMLNNIKDNIIEIEKEINNKENDKDKTNVIHEFYLIKNKTENFKKECESLLTDICITKEFTFDNTFHTIEQCKSNKELNKHSKNVSRLCKKLDDLSEELKLIKEEKKVLLKKGKEENKALKKGKETEKVSKIQKTQDMYERNMKLGQKERTQILTDIKKLPVEFVIGPVYTQASYNYAKNNYGPDTSGMLDMAHEKRFNPKYEKDTIKLKNWNDEKVASDKKYLVEKVGEQFMDFGFDINEIPGYFFKNNSEPSKRIANDADFLDKIKKNKENILNGKDISMEFPNYGHNKKSNLHFAFGHIDIRNGYLDKEGNLHVKVYDTYDFNKNNKTPLNQAGREQMLKGNLKPFFTIHDILIPKEKVSKLWK